MPALKKDPAPGITPGDGSIIRTDQWNIIVDRAGGEPALTANRAIATDGSGNLEAQTTTKADLALITAHKSRHEPGGADAFSGTLNDTSVDKNAIRVQAYKKRQVGLAVANAGLVGSDSAYGLALTSEGTATVAADADGLYGIWTSAATTNNDAGNFVTSGYRRDYNFDVTIKFRVVQTVVRRAWIGFFSADPMTSDAPTAAHIGVRVSTSAGSTQFVLSHADGTTQAETNLGAADGGVHTIRIVAVDGSSKFQYSFDGAALVDVTTNIPASTTALGVWHQVRTLEAVAKAIHHWFWAGLADK